MCKSFILRTTCASSKNSILCSLLLWGNLWGLPPLNPSYQTLATILLKLFINTVNLFTRMHTRPPIFLLFSTFEVSPLAVLYQLPITVARNCKKQLQITLVFWKLSYREQVFPDVMLSMSGTDTAQRGNEQRYTDDK